MKTYQRSLLILCITCASFMMLFITFGSAQNGRSSSARRSAGRKNEKVASRPQKPALTSKDFARIRKAESDQKLEPYSSVAIAFIETPAARDLKPAHLSKEEMERLIEARKDREKNERNVRRVKPEIDRSITAPFADPTLGAQSAMTIQPNAVTAPLQNFDGPDADGGVALFGTRFAPPDTNAAVGPNHVVVTTNMGVRVTTKPACLSHHSLG